MCIYAIANEHGYRNTKFVHYCLTCAGGLSPATTACTLKVIPWLPPVSAITNTLIIQVITAALGRGVPITPSTTHANAGWVTFCSREQKKHNLTMY